MTGQLEAPPVPPRFDLMVVTGGIGSGILFALDGDHDLGRHESRAARRLEARDYAKAHIVSHCLARLLHAPGLAPRPRIAVVGAVGDDEIGHRLIAELRDAGLDLTYVRIAPDAPTLLSVCYLYPDGTGGNITDEASASATVSDDDLAPVVEPLARVGDRGLVIALPEVPATARLGLLQAGSSSGAFRVASLTKGEAGTPVAERIVSASDLMVFNEEEAAAFGRSTAARAEARAVLDATAARADRLHPGIQVVVTWGADGAYAFVDGSWHHTPAPHVTPVSSAGAGDALLAGVVAALALGAPLTRIPDRATTQPSSTETAMELGVLVGSYGVTSPHSIHPEFTTAALHAFANAMGRPMSGALRTGLAPGAHADGPVHWRTPIVSN